METEQIKRKLHGRVADSYHKIHEYKALSDEQKKELKDLGAYRGITLIVGTSTKVLSRDNWQPLNNNFQSSNQTMELMLGLLRMQLSLASKHLHKPQLTRKTLITAIILLSLINKPDARLKRTEKLMDHLEEELLSQIKTQPDTQMQSGLPVLGVSPSTLNLTAS